MPRSDDPTLTIPDARGAFRTANPEVFGKAQGDVDTTRRLGAVETRAEDIKQRFYAHFERHELAWTAAEALRLAKNRDFPTFQHPAPSGLGSYGRGPNVAELMMTTARQNVHARAINRLSAINTVKANLQNALIRNRPAMQAKTPANDTEQKQGIRNKGP